MKLSDERNKQFIERIKGLKETEKLLLFVSLCEWVRRWKGEGVSTDLYVVCVGKAMEGVLNGFWGLSSNGMVEDGNFELYHHKMEQDEFTVQESVEYLRGLVHPLKSEDISMDKIKANIAESALVLADSTTDLVKNI